MRGPQKAERGGRVVRVKQGTQLAGLQKSQNLSIVVGMVSFGCKKLSHKLQIHPKEKGFKIERKLQYRCENV